MSRLPTATIPRRKDFRAVPAPYYSQGRSITISTPVPLTGAFSEWQNDEGHTRPHYAGIAEAAGLLGPDGLSERWSDAQRQVDLDAFTFYLDPGKYRPAPVDWIPRHTSRPMAGDLTGRRPAYHGDQSIPC